MIIYHKHTNMVKRIFLYILILFTVSSCHLEDPTPSSYQSLVIEKGTHVAKPLWLDIRERERLELEHVFDKSVAYDLGNRNQFDWNKLTGVSFHDTNSRINTAMVSWRWGLECHCIELGFYYYKNRERLIISDESGNQVFATAQPGHRIETYFNLQYLETDSINAVGITILTPSDTAYNEQDFSVPVTKSTRVINPWFGGNEKAPHNIFLKRKLIE